MTGSLSAVIVLGSIGLVVVVGYASIRIKHILMEDEESDD